MNAIYEVPQHPCRPDWGIAQHLLHMAAYTRMSNCVICGDLADSIKELGFCYHLGSESLQQQIAEYRRDEAEWHLSHNAEVTGVPALSARPVD